MIGSLIGLLVLALHGAWGVASASILWTVEKAGRDRGSPVFRMSGVVSVACWIDGLVPVKRVLAFFV